MCIFIYLFIYVYCRCFLRLVQCLNIYAILQLVYFCLQKLLTHIASEIVRTWSSRYYICA